MNYYENYFFLTFREKKNLNYDLFVNGSGMALIVPMQPTIIVLEISRPAMATAFRKHLLHKADAVEHDRIYR